MNVSQLSLDLINQLRSWFYAKDRAIVIDRNIRAYNVPSGATMAMALIEEQELAVAASSVTFSSIPQNFRSLLLVIQARTNAVAEFDTMLVTFNGDNGNNYDRLALNFSTGGGTSITATRATSSINAGLVEAASSRANNWSILTTEIIGYSLSDREKWVSSSNSGAFGNVSADADLFISIRRGRWRNTGVIQAITLFPAAGPNFVAGSIFTLYGIL